MISLHAALQDASNIDLSIRLDSCFLLLANRILQQKPSKGQRLSPLANKLQGASDIGDMHKRHDLVYFHAEQRLYFVHE